MTTSVYQDHVSATGAHVARKPWPWAKIASIVLLLVCAVIMIAPFLWIMQAAFSDAAAAYVLPPRLFPSEPTLANFQAVFDLVPYGSFILNSLFVATTITIGQLITCSMGAYAFARLEFPGKRILFVVLLATLMIPLQVTIVPQFILMRQAGLYNTHAAIILPALVSPFGIFLLRQYFMTIPTELEDAARIDGAGYFTIFWRIIVPLSAPALTTLGIVCFVYWWNEYFIPLIMINSPELQLLPVGLTLLRGRYSAGAVGNVAAGVTMAVIPVLIIFLFFQRHIIKSIATTGLKG
ncbi:MAG: carbohydrate ABC transporter permease [Anaerolineae bacterium]|nr:carbohydrate ABC transporter permease [Anaerolineae bacterium]